MRCCLYTGFLYRDSLRFKSRLHNARHSQGITVLMVRFICKRLRRENYVYQPLAPHISLMIELYCSANSDGNSYSEMHRRLGYATFKRFISMSIVYVWRVQKYNNCYSSLFHGSCARLYNCRRILHCFTSLASYDSRC